MSNIMQLPTIKMSANVETVECLEELLEQAKAGEIISIAYACGRDNGDVYTGYTTTVEFHNMNSGLAILQHRLIAGRSEGGE